MPEPTQPRDVERGRNAITYDQACPTMRSFLRGSWLPHVMPNKAIEDLQLIHAYALNLACEVEDGRAISPEARQMAGEILDVARGKDRAR